MTIEVDDPARRNGLDKIVAEEEIKKREELYEETAAKWLYIGR